MPPCNVLVRCIPGCTNPRVCSVIRPRSPRRAVRAAGAATSRRAPPMSQSPLPEYVPLADAVRSGMRESVHDGAVVGRKTDGSSGYVRGPVHQPMFPRSSAKPFQAVAMLRAGAHLEGESLAIAAGSHGGEDFHAAEVGRMLAKAGLAADALQCRA